ncbi:hypothetical protein EJ05DRAFT_145398 [Pseudovirgaria hyperparasitica]|uniref:Uncharacterized protein n=1 Tax=Pseudovirgaria hyperparasitica TaxID=470096 RepID=A0A6A6W0I9_9PEZI|nr:uncharacterized protein EJ05DRAFT_145398 [Pseudovirgaria hyperparasitica]KAF2754581.1 hypothetical protein EJ05DRAFT_145398 [Pseudovirgaria hyperparasitica]
MLVALYNIHVSTTLFIHTAATRRRIRWERRRRLLAGRSSTQHNHRTFAPPSKPPPASDSPPSLLLHTPTIRFVRHTTFFLYSLSTFSCRSLDRQSLFIPPSGLS